MSTIAVAIVALCIVVVIAAGFAIANAEDHRNRRVEAADTADQDPDLK